MKYNVYWTTTAQNDLNDIYSYISTNESENIAISIYERIKKRSLSLETLPLRGRIIPELSYQNIEGYRELIDHPWRIVYKIANDTVYILCVFDGRRSFEHVLMDRILNS